MGMRKRIHSWYSSRSGAKEEEEEASSRRTTTIPCGICKRKYGTANLDKFFAHLGAHFDMRHRLNRCDECRINFVSPADLNVHLRSANLQRICGFMFEHREPCKGHHPQHHGGSYDDNRFDFCYRLQGWEYAQIQSQQPHQQELSIKHHRQTSTLGPFTDFINLHLRTSTTSPITLPATSVTSNNTNTPHSSNPPKHPIAPQTLLDMLLLHAIPTASLPLLTSLLSVGASPKTTTDSLGFTAMHYAAQYGTPETAWLLIQSGASFSTPDRNGDVPLIHAIRGRNADLVHYLLAWGQAKVSRREIEASVQNGNAEAAGMLLEHRKQCRDESAGNERDEVRWLDELLVQAVRRDDAEMVRVLLEYGARADVATEEQEGEGGGGEKKGSVARTKENLGKMEIVKVRRESGRDGEEVRAGRVYLHERKSIHDW